MARYRVTVDTGGTFSDFVYLNEDTGAVTISKVPSTPDDPSRAILQGIETLMRQHRAQSVGGRATESAISVTAPRSAPTRCSKARACEPASW